ncbi:MAG TPA: hypothetical protein VIL49_02040, partial [Capillimicrobium sp.]
RALRPAPLSAPAAAALVRRHLPQAADGFADACHEATGGNPFLLGELLREIVADGREGTSAEAADVLQFGAERVGRAIRRRLRLQPRAALGLARAVAVLGGQASLDEAAALAGLDEAEAASAADALAAVDLLGAGHALDFVHPVVRAAVYEQIAPRERQALHRAAAALLHEHGAESERVATHLLRLPAVDPDHVPILRAAAQEALGRGDTEMAAAHLRRALEGEAVPERRADILHALGRAEAAGQHGDFRARFTEALRAAGDLEHRARIALDYGSALTSSGNLDESVAVFRNALECLDDHDSPLALRLDAEMSTLAFIDFAWRDLAQERAARRLAQLEAGEDLDPVTAATVVWPLATSRGPVGAALDVIDRIAAVTRLDENDSVLQATIGNNLMHCGEMGRAGRFYDEGIADARRKGARSMLVWQSVMRSIASLHLGEVRRAETEARLAQQFGGGLGEAGLVWTIPALANVLMARGALAEAEELVAAHPLARSSQTFGHAVILTAYADLHLALGRPSVALQDATDAGRLLLPTMTNPICCPWRATATLALLALERRDEAVAMAEQELADARRFAFDLAEGGALRSL